MQNPVLPIVEWYAREGRKLPWRESKDPYRIWLSEIIMQQTRVEQGLAYFDRFLEEFPSVHHLAAATPDTVMKCWEGLGYYSRARNLHATAKEISQKFDGRFPAHHSELEKLKGVGPYTARAIASIAFGSLVGVVDGNVQRVLSRYMALNEPVDSSTTKRLMQGVLDSWLLLANISVDKSSFPGDFNQGMMDLGAMVCKPTHPRCDVCPIQVQCAAFKGDMQNAFPVKSGKVKRKTIYMQFFLLMDSQGRILIQRRPEKGIWGGLWELPNNEVQKEVWKEKTLTGHQFLGGFKHVLTHLDMMINVFAGSVEMNLTDASQTWKHSEEMQGYGFSRAVLKIFERFLP